MFICVLCSVIAGLCYYFISCFPQCQSFVVIYVVKESVVIKVCHRKQTNKDISPHPTIKMKVLTSLVYSERKITPSLGCVTVRVANGKPSHSRAPSSIVQLKTFSSHLISTQSVAFSYTDFYTTLYFVNQRNYKTLAMQAHALTRTRYFYSPNVIISHPIVHKEGLGYSPYVLSLHGLPLPPTCVFVMVIQVWRYLRPL
jgi:hypothetical protein